MTTTDLRPDRANLVGSLWMIAAMAFFAIEDALLKAGAQSLPVGQVLMTFGFGGAVIFALWARLVGTPLFIPEAVSRPMRIRVLFEILGRLFFMLAIALTPLSAATVILQATPLAVVAGAAVLFGETVGWRRWTAILIGLVGVAIIVQPGAESFSALSLLAIIAMIGFAGRDLASRAAPPEVGTAALGFYGFLALIIAGGILLLWEGAWLVMPQGSVCLYLGAAILSGVVAYSSLMKAMRTGEVSAVTPFRYTRLIFGIGLGVLFFGERLDLTMLIGSGLIVLSGLFILWRGRK